MKHTELKDEEAINPPGPFGWKLLSFLNRPEISSWKTQSQTQKKEANKKILFVLWRTLPFGSHAQPFCISMYTYGCGGFLFCFMESWVSTTLTGQGKQFYINNYCWFVEIIFYLYRIVFASCITVHIFRINYQCPLSLLLMILKGLSREEDKTDEAKAWPPGRLGSECLEYSLRYHWVGRQVAVRMWRRSLLWGC